MKPASLDGLLILDKPGGMTSRAALDRAAQWFPDGTRMGHTGTLDPLATGVLVLCLGVATRLAEYVQRMRKTYRTTLLLGSRSDTDDVDGTVTPVPGAPVPELRAVEQRLAEFIGEIEQVPPAYSAAKVSGRRSYDLAREGEEVALTARRVRIDGIDVLGYAYPRLELEVRCGKGTYIRALARDLGERLGCGALVEVLRRTSVGPFTTADAVTLEADAATARARLLPVAAAVQGLWRVNLEAKEAARLRQGQNVPLDRLVREAHGDEAAVFDSAGKLVAVAGVDYARGLLRPEKVLPT
jgi:tRNA pseudouridine55 synthase